ncbi:MAG: restriction endonuclease subunit S [Syntrophaceae bacterium]|nr:restriction endonuclease subunit S [Syntrophaceae bacterium]
MSSLKFVEKLLDGVAMEWKTLGSLGEFVRGSGLQKSDFRESGVGCIHYGQIYTFYGDYAFNTKSFVSPELARKLRKAKKGDLIIATTSENIEDVCKSVVWLGEDDICVSGETYIFSHNQNPKYLAYVLKTPDFFDFKTRNQTGTKVIRVHGDKLAEFSVPIPCPDNPKKSLEIQAEIVRILDTFTELTAELTTELATELTARKKQYNYYRDRLLSFEEGEVEWKTLGEVITDKFWIMPATPKFDENENIPYITSKNIRSGHICFEKVKYISHSNYLNLSRNRPILAGDFLISMIGTIGEVARVKATDLDFYGQNMYLVRLDEKLINSDYFLHFFDSPKMKNHFNSVKNNSGQGYLKSKDIEDLKIPVPSLEVQTKVVKVLDRFLTLANSITEGLPREIELRQKQYEYYRNLLLSFPRPEAQSP